MSSLKRVNIARQQPYSKSTVLIDDYCFHLSVDAKESIPDETTFIKFIQVLVLAEDFSTCICSIASHPQFAKNSTFEHAYALYRQSQYHAAQALLKPVVECNGSAEARILTLYAQAVHSNLNLKL